MTRQTSPKNSPGSNAPERQAGGRIADMPRDCGPNVDTWPILDQQAGSAPKQKRDGNRK